jgi:hypothetical protein
VEANGSMMDAVDEFAAAIADAGAGGGRSAAIDHPGTAATVRVLPVAGSTMSGLLRRGDRPGRVRRAQPAYDTAVHVLASAEHGRLS